ncbi:MAG: hypothetical protein QW594_03510 [Candidatus Woesearchaeota archaeon]
MLNPLFKKKFLRSRKNIAYHTLKQTTDKKAKKRKKRLAASIVLTSASTRSFRLGMCALFYISLGPRRGQVPLKHCKHSLQSLS